MPWFSDGYRVRKGPRDLSPWEKKQKRKDEYAAKIRAEVKAWEKRK